MRIWLLVFRTLPPLPICASPPDCGGGERLQIAVVYLGGKAGGPDLVEARVLVDVDRETVRADGTVEHYRQLVLLMVPDCGDGADQPGSLRQK